MTSRKPFYRSRYFQVIVAILLGVFLPFLAANRRFAKPLGDGFIKLGQNDDRAGSFSVLWSPASPAWKT